jgi:hypothetical protein
MIDARVILEQVLCLENAINDPVFIKRNIKKRIRGMVNGDEPYLEVPPDIKILADEYVNYFQKFVMEILANQGKRLSDGARLYVLFNKGIPLTLKGTINTIHVGMLCDIADIYENCVYMDNYDFLKKRPTFKNEWIMYEEWGGEKIRNAECEVFNIKKNNSYPGYSVYGLIDDKLVSWYSHRPVEIHKNYVINGTISECQRNWEFDNYLETRLKSVKILGE